MKSELVAHAVLLTFGVDTVFVATRAAQPRAAAPVFVAFATPAAPLAATVPSATQDAMPPAQRDGVSAVVPARRRGLPPSFSPLRRGASRHAHGAAGPAPGALDSEACDDAVEAGTAPLTTLARDLLWPANHSLIDIGLNVDPTPVCAGLLDLTVQVWGDELDDAPGSGDGETTGDARFDVPDLFLRAERMGVPVPDPATAGRVYLVITLATTSGNVEGHNCGTAVVPHSGNAAFINGVRAQADTARSHCVATGEAPAGYVLLAEAPFTDINHAPVVDAGPDLGTPVPSVTIDATASDDGLPDGLLQLAWTQVEGPGQATFSDASAEDPTVTFSVPGTYILRLTADDGELEAHDDVNIVVAIANQPPVVDAGDDQTLILPDDTATLDAIVTDDGLPDSILLCQWSVVEAPPGASVTFTAPSSCESTDATFSAVGAYVLKLTAFDGALYGEDTVRIVVNPAPLPTVTVSNASALELDEGRAGAEIEVHLSQPWPRPVTFDYVTIGGTASADCDYTFSFGTFTIEAGVTEKTLIIPVVGDLADEPDETVTILLGNETEAVLAAGQAVLTITDDDATNARPTAHASRQPADGSTGLPLPPTLSWSSVDPDAGDTVTHDAFFASSVPRDGQSWSKSCPAASGPLPSTAFASDGDRIIVLEQEADGSTGSDVYVLGHAGASGGAPAWTSYATQNGPHIGSARAAYDAAGDRLIVVGRCLSGCTDGIETWVLANAGGGGTPAWTRIAAPNAPAETSGFAVGYAAETNRLYLFGGTDSAGSRLDDLWVLDGANGTGTPAWTLTAPAGPGPSARDAASLVVDTRTNRLLLFGGAVSATVASDETWALRLAGAPAWELLAADDPRPTARFGHAAVFDHGSGRMLVFGGTTPGIVGNTNFVFGDAWLLDGPVWTKVTVPPLAPVGRYDAMVAYSADANRLVVSAGRNNKVAPEASRDLWLLDAAMGRLPALALEQPAASFVPSNLDVDHQYFWRGVTRDNHGGWRGAPVWRFTGNEAPSVEAGPNQSITLPATASLAAVPDDDGHPNPSLALLWAKVSGPGSVTFADPAAATTTATFGAAGAYVLSVTVDDGMFIASDSLTVAVADDNQPPTVSAGPDQMLVSPSWTANLDGTVVDDGLPNPPAHVDTTWSVVSSPPGAPPVDFGNESEIDTTAAFAAAGVYVLRLSATDGEPPPVSDDVSVEVFLQHDLVIPSMNASQMVTNPNTLAVSGTVAVDVDNVANGPIAQAFVVKVFEDLNGNGTFEAANDNLLGSAEVAGLAAHATTTAPVTVSGTVLFVGNRIHAFVDANGAVAESNEANNYQDTFPPCNPGPPPAFAAASKWTWNPSDWDTGGSRVIMTPAVADLDGDGDPEVIFSTHWPGDWAGLGRLRVLDGTNGALLFSTGVSSVNAISQIAVGDLDGDGSPDIVATRGSQVVAFNHDLSHPPKWISEAIDHPLWGGPALADLDHDGEPEIVIGRTVLNSDGSIRWKGDPTNMGSHGLLSLVADLDGDSYPEIVAGSTVYTSDGQVHWTTDAYVTGGLNAIGNFDGDAQPEVVLVSGGAAWVFEHDGVYKWGPVPIPNPGPGLMDGGPPVVADLDGDGDAEIGVAGASRYAVFEIDDGDLVLKWAATIQDASHVTGASVFDFEGDGIAEVVYRDQANLFVFRGTDGAVLFQTAMQSATGYENPVVADVDGDGAADLLVVADAGAYGVYAYESTNALWMPTRKIWNQHTYHVTNVSEDLTVPSFEANNWEIYNSYRRNTVATACALPDLTASYLRHTPLPGPIELTVRIGNSGGLIAPSLPVSFYAAQPTAASVPLATAITAGTIAPGGFRDVSVLLPAGTTALPIWIVADDAGDLAGTVMEGDETNNAYKSRLYLTVPPNQPPLVNAGPDITITVPDLLETIQGSAEDPDHLPINELIVAWGLVSSNPPGLGVTFDPPNAAVTEATFDGPGRYTLRLHASDADLDPSDDVVVEVLADAPDLTVPLVEALSYAVDPQTLGVTGVVSGQIHNGGTQDAGPFAVTAYEEVDGEEGFDPADDNPLGSASVAGLASQATTTAYITVSGTADFAVEDVRVVADPADLVDEQRETNNVGRAPHGCEVGGGCTGAEPDLIPSYVRIEDIGSEIRVTARIGNAGNTLVAAGVGIGFYDGDPIQEDSIGSVTTTVAIPAGGFIDVSVVFPETTSAQPIWVLADDPSVPNGLPPIVESVETNNAYNSRLFHPAHANDPPEVDAGDDLVVDYPSQQAVLDDATATDDGIPGVPLAYRWRQLSGPGAATFVLSTDLHPTVNFSATGSYVLRLEVDDSEKVGSDDITVHVDPANVPPSVNAGPNAPATNPRFQLAGVVQDDGLPRNATLSIAWSLVTGPPAGQATFDNPADPDTFVEVTKEGTYTLRLTANDSTGAVTDDVDWTVTFVNQAPQPNAGPDATIQLPDTDTPLAGSHQDDGLPLNATYTYTWSQREGPSGVVFSAPNAANTNATFADPGTYLLRLRVSDGELSATDEVQVQVLAESGCGGSPAAAITGPAPGIAITQPTMIVGTATSPSLASWKLEHRLAGGGSDWTRFAFGITGVTSGNLAALDTTLLLNGLHDVRLSVTNTCGVAAQTLTQVVVRDNFKVGHFTVSFVDMEVPVAGMPLQITRTYDSRDKRMGDFGYGWRLDVSNVRIEETGVAGLGWEGTRSPGDWPTYCLVPTTPKVVTITMPNGRVLEFDAAVTPQCQWVIPPSDVVVSYHPRSNTRGTLIPLDTGLGRVIGAWPAQNQPATPMQVFQESDFTLFDPEVYELTLPDGRKFVVSQAAGLQTVRDLNGNLLTVTPTGIAHSSGQTIQIVRQNGNGRVTEIKDPDGKSVFYGNASGDLETVTDREQNVTTFEYEEDIPHHLRTIEDPMNRVPIRNDYDGNGRLEKHTDADGYTIVYDHRIPEKVERIKDRSGTWRHLKYDERGNVEKEGRLIQPIDLEPARDVVRRTFDLRNNRLTETIPHDEGTPNPPKTVYVYTTNDEVETVTDPDNNTTKYKYNDRGQVEEVQDPEALAGAYLSTKNEYDATTGNLLRTTDAVGTKTEYTYDPADRGNPSVQKVIAANGTVLAWTEYDYANGVLTEERNLDATGTNILRKTEFLNGIHGVTERKTWRIPAPGQPQEPLITTYVYNDNGQLWKTFDADSATFYTETEYNDAGQPWKTYDKSRRMTEHLYDDMGRLEKTTYPGGSYEEIAYSPEGQRKTFRDRMGNVTQYCYDAAGRLTKTRPPQPGPLPDPPCSAGAFVENVYDAAGRLWKTIDAEGNLTEYEYWPSGRRKKVFDPENGALNPRKFTEFAYDRNGNLRFVTDPKGEVTEHIYDRANRRTQAKPPIVGTEPQRFTETTYDGLGRRTKERDLAGEETDFEYDALGQLWKVKQHLDTEVLVTEYAYDEVGSRITQTDAKGRETKFEYDKLGRETKRTLPLGAFETKTYTVDGSLDLHTDFNGHVTDYDYETVTGRLAEKDYADPLMPDVGFTYEADGRRETVTIGAGNPTLYDYDERRRLTLLQYPDGRKLEYAYDHNGFRTSLKATLGAQVLETTFTPDGNNRLEDVTDPDARIYHHGYDPNGNREALVYPNQGVTTAYVYDEQNRLKTLTTTRPGAPPTTIQSYAFGLGPAGNRTSITEADGVSRAYGYDDLYRLETETITGAGPGNYAKTFQYDDVGNREQQVTTGLNPGTIDYTYDDRDRLETETGVPGGYGYDANGNLLDKADGATDYEWDRENRLTKVILPNGTQVTHAYDADGNRVQTTTTPPGGPAAVTNYLVDTSGSLSHVVAETDAAGALTAYYVRGDELLAVMRPANPSGWQTRFVHADGIGSIRKLTDENGLVTDTYTYSAFGELLSHDSPNPDPQPYAFAGEPLDPNVGFQYHRARWMDTTTARFSSLDPFDGVPTQPSTLHRYLYAGANPMSNVDPTGAFLESLFTAMAVMTTIASVSVSASPYSPSNTFSPLLVATDLLAVNSDRLDDASVLSAFTGGQGIWASQASIYFTAPRGIRRVPAVQALEEVAYTQAQFRDAVQTANLFSTGRHVTVFVPQTRLVPGTLGAQVTGVSSLGTNSGVSGKGFSFAGQLDGRLVAHEWGHTLSLLNNEEGSGNLTQQDSSGVELSPLQISRARLMARVAY